MTPIPTPAIDPTEIARVVNTFSLLDFPYDPDESLNPLEDDDHSVPHSKLISRVDGWRNVAQVETVIAQRAQAGKPVVVVVSGGTGCGRSSLARHLVSHWVESRANLDRELLLIADQPVKNYRAREHLWNWVLDFRPWARNKHVELSGTANTAFSELAKAVPDAEALAVTLQDVISQFVVDLAAEHGALAGILEGVNDRFYVTEITRCVRFVDTCVVLTIKETDETRATILDDIEELLDTTVGCHIHLEVVSGADMTTLARDRWAACAANKTDPMPFDPAGLTAAFAGQPRSLKLALSLMRALLMSLDGAQRLDAQEVARQMRVLNRLLFDAGAGR